MLDAVKLGRSGPLVSRIGFGCMGMSANYEADHEDDESAYTLQKAYEAGVNFFDTADMYGDGHNEALLGEALRYPLENHRKHIVIATKCGFVRHPETVWRVDVSPSHIKQACLASLKRLGITYIDLYYLHRCPAGGTETIKASLDALVELLKSEKIKYVGLSEADEATIRFADQYLKDQGFPQALAAVQSEFSLFTQGPLKNGVLKTCEEIGLNFIPYSPLSRGLLTKKMNAHVKFDEGDFRQCLPRFQGENFENNLKIRDKLIEFAKTNNCTLTQLSLAWLLAQSACVVPIPGTRYLKNLKSNLGSLTVNLTEEDLISIEKIVSGVKGTRYPEALYEP
ncbi:MAG TPA: aldo/keto reductase [Alphaproteobacteria bacterium]|nr:aldo/keto reductase [Alphaproteobacteria bacterium]HQS94745.1 aldo/keto reductase [Alphaproteobacteria bacterium]